MSAFRTASGGRIDRSRPLRFSFDGREYQGCTGDTLASALLANGVHLLARSFKYHRPRGVLAAGADEPSALVTVIRDDARRTPNLRATQIELYDGLRAESQNHYSVARLRPWRRQRFSGAAVSGRVLLQDVQMARLGVASRLRTGDPRRRRPRPRADAAGSGSLRTALCALRRAGGGRRTGRPRRRARRRGNRRAGHPVRRAGGTGRLAAGGDNRNDRRRASPGLARRDARHAHATSARDAAAADHGVRLLSAQHGGPGAAADRPPRRARSRTRPRASVAGAPARARAGDRRAGAAAGVSRQRPAGDHAGRRGAHLSATLRRAARTPRRGGDGA